MSTTNPQNPGRGSSGTQPPKAGPLDKSRETSRTGASPSSAPDASGMEQGIQQNASRQDSDVLRCLDAIDDTVRKCRLALGQEGSRGVERSSGDRSDRDRGEGDHNEPSSSERGFGSR